MRAHYQTDTGKVRSHNEDSVTIVKNLNNEYLLVVADGMGGHKAGEIASSKAVTIMGSRFSKLSSVGTKEEAIIWLKEIVDEINVDILKYADENLNAKGLGTTCVCALLTTQYLLFGNIGDSSGFVMKQGKLTKVTTDHTIVGLLLKNGEITEEEAKNHPQKNVLMKALGSAEKISMDMFEVEIDIDDIFLCTDGLTNMVSKEQIEKILNDDSLDMEEKVNKLILKANVRGGTDNITIAYLSKKEGN